MNLLRTIRSRLWVGFGITIALILAAGTLAVISL